MIGLFAAVECGDTKKVEQLLVQFPQETVSLKKVDYRKRTALHFAVELGHEEVVEVLLDHEGDNDLLCAKDGAGFTALHLACELGHDKIVARLLGKNPKLADDRAAESELSCLHLAVIRGKVSVVKLLLTMAPDLVTMEDKPEKLPLHFAIEYGHEEIIEVLMECAKSNTKYGEAMFHAAIRSGHGKIVSQLLDHRPQLIDVVNSRGISPLHLAAYCGRHAIVEQLFARRQPRLGEVGGDYDMTLLHFAAQYGYDTIVAELLVEQPHLIGVVSGYRRMTALHIAAVNGHEKIVQQLLAHKPDLVDVVQSDGTNALNLATSYGHQQIVEQLLALKPGLIDVADQNQNTALDLACYLPQPELVACLLAHKPAVVTEDLLWNALNFGKEPSKAREILKLLLAHKPELVESVDYRGNTLLHRVFGYELYQQFYKCEDADDLADDEREWPLFDDQMMNLVWQLSPPNFLRVTNRANETPFDVAIHCDNKFAIELVQWKFSLDEIMEAFAKCGGMKDQCFPSLLDQLCETLLLSLDRDVVGTMWEYLGFERPQRKKRGRESKQQ